MNEDQHNDNSFFMQTQMGVVTQKGDWFHINKEKVEEFAPGLLKHTSFSSLIKEAQAWVESVSSLSLILAYALLFFINPWAAGIIATAFHFFWHQYKSGFVINKLYKLFFFINSTPFLFILALICLSYFAMQSQFIAFGIGLLFFIVMKPGLLRKGWDKINGSSSGLTSNDRLLRMIIIKHAIYTKDSSPEEVAQMEERFADLISNIKS